MADLIEVHLNLPDCSGRGVRFKLLTPAERDRVTEKAASLLVKDASVLDLRLGELREGVKAMVTAVTKKPVEPGKMRDASTEWRQLSLEEKVNEYDSLFTCKDDVILTNLYKKYHEIQGDEMEAIMGKVVRVSSD